MELYVSAAIQSLNQKESYVAVSNITFVASASSMVLSGYKMKLIDVDKDTGLFKINSLKQLINKYKISCLINVHLNGNIDNLKKFIQFVKNNIKLLKMLVTHLVRLTKLEIQHIMLVIIRSVIFSLYHFIQQN